MLYFNGTRKPDYKNTGRIDYTTYWQQRGVSINKKLKEREFIMARLIPKGSSVYDISCGSSRLPLVLKEADCKVTVSDVSPLILEEQKKHGISTSILDLNCISEKEINAQYDFIILSEVLEHLTNPEEVIRTFSPHTTRFIVTIPNSAFYRYRIHLFFFGRFFTQWAVHPSEHVRYWSHRDFKDWLGDMDVVLEHAEASNGLSLFGMPLYRWWPNLFGHQILYVCRTK